MLSAVGPFTARTRSPVVASQKYVLAYLRSGDLTPIHVHDGESEAMRDLSRCREDALAAKQAARQQLGGFMLRHDRRYPGKKQGTKSGDKGGNG